ncbi:MAG: DUF2628 domain-containing protein [Acidobacteriota bacterium]
MSESSDVDPRLRDLPENPYAPPQAQAAPVPRAEREEDDLRTFIGPRSDYYLDKWRPVLEGSGEKIGFNWAAFFLSGLWLTYRKMYRFAFIFAAIIIVESVLEEIFFVQVLGHETAPAVVSNAVNALTAVVFGAFGNFWYLIHCRRKIHLAGALAPTPESRDASLQKAGGTSALGPLLFTAAFFTALVLVFVLLDPVIYGAG